MFCEFAEKFSKGPWFGIQSNARRAVSLEKAFDVDEQISPDGLRAGITTPDTSSDGGDKKERDGCQDEQTREVVDFLRPDFDPEEIEAAMRKIQKDRLIWSKGTAVPSDPRGDIVDCQAHRHHNPFDEPVPSLDKLWVYFYPAGVEGTIFFRIDGCRRFTLCSVRIYKPLCLVDQRGQTLCGVGGVARHVCLMVSAVACGTLLAVVLSSRRSDVENTNPLGDVCPLVRR